MRELASAVKASINSTNLQFWAVEILKTNTHFSSISEDKLPMNILRLRNQGFQLEPCILETNCVLLLCWKTHRIFGASTTGYYGICVGSTNFQPTEETRSYTNWKPGIYFWYDRTMM